MQVKPLFLAAGLFLHAVALPIARDDTSLARRQDDEDAEDDDQDSSSGSGGLLPVLGSVTDGLGDFSPIEDGQFETDADASGGNDSGASNSETANGLTGGGTGSSANNNDTAVASSSQCSLFSCTSGAASGNDDGTSTSTSSSGGLINAPLVQTDGPLVQTGKRFLRRLNVIT